VKAGGSKRLDALWRAMGGAAFFVLSCSGDALAQIYGPPPSPYDDPVPPAPIAPHSHPIDGPDDDDFDAPELDPEEMMYHRRRGLVVAPEFDEPDWRRPRHWEPPSPGPRAGRSLVKAGPPRAAPRATRPSREVRAAPVARKAAVIASPAPRAVSPPPAKRAKAAAPAVSSAARPPPPAVSSAARTPPPAAPNASGAPSAAQQKGFGPPTALMNATEGKSNMER
jgi:hypothetical protein